MISQRVLIQILDDIEYKKCLDGTDTVVSGFIFGNMGKGWYIQHWQMLRDCNDYEAGGLETEQRGRKWYVSKHCAIGEVVQTALSAILMFEEHEAREGFMYQGTRLFGPHIHHQALRIASIKQETRDDRMG